MESRESREAWPVPDPDSSASGISQTRGPFGVSPVSTSALGAILAFAKRRASAG